MTDGDARGGDDLSPRLHAAVAPIAAAADVDLVDVEVRGQRGSRIVRLVADAEGGLDIDRIARLSHDVGDVIDEIVPGSYTLEVTSPGTDRPLRTGRDFARNVGREVRVQRTRDAAANAPGEVVGTVVAVEEDRVVLEVDGDRLDVPLRDVAHGKVVLPW